ncbi:LamG domain-containing protein [Tamlana flava]|uniref:LamG domain-containing protein n=1 Tax=Tamlana flava TaxID=3158572 RepID=UPI00351B8A08
MMKNKILPLCENLKTLKLIFLLVSIAFFHNYSQGQEYKKLVGNAIIGHDGSWGNNPSNLKEAAFDGDINTYVDAPSPIGFVGYDFGITRTAKIYSIKYAPRPEFETRILGTEIRGSNDPSFRTYSVLHTISNMPVAGKFSEDLINASESYRFICFYSSNGFCNIAELEFYGSLSDVEIPTLSDLQIDKGVLSPPFEPGHFEYSILVPSGVTTINLKVIPEKKSFSVVGDQKISLLEDHAKTTINVTNGATTTTYTIKAIPFKLKHSYTFDDGTANDIVGEAHGAIRGTIQSEGKVIDGLFVTYDQGQFIELPADKIKINEYSAITLEAFILASKGSDTKMISFFGNSTGNFGTDYIAQWVHNNEFSWTGISCNNDIAPWETITQVSGKSLQDDAYHHIVTTFDNQEIKYYIDGTLVGKQTTLGHKSNIIANLSNNLAYLCRSGYLREQTWLGGIDEFNIYEGILDAETIAKSAKKYLETSKDRNKTFYKSLISLTDLNEGFRPTSDLSDEFIKTLKKSKIEVYPTILRTVDSTTWSETSGKEFAASLKSDLELDIDFNRKTLNPDELRGKNQFEIFNNEMDSLGEKIRKEKTPSDYNIVLEILFAPKQSERLNVFGIHVYVLTNDGKNAYSFLLNSHHDSFKYAQLFEDHVTKESLETLKQKCTWVALEVFKKQLNNKISHGSKPIDYEDYHGQLSRTTLYTNLPTPTTEDFRNGALQYHYPLKPSELKKIKNLIIGDWVMGLAEYNYIVANKLTFNADGKFTSTSESSSTFKYELKGDSLVTELPNNLNKKQKFEVEGSKLYLYENNNRSEYTRTEGDSSSGILGKWTTKIGNEGTMTFEFTPSNNLNITTKMIADEGTFEINANLIEFFSEKGGYIFMTILAVDDDNLSIKSNGNGNTFNYVRPKEQD